MTHGTAQAVTAAVAQRLFVQPLADKDAATWDRFVASHPRASVYHLSTWRRVIEEVFHHQTYYFAAWTEDAELVGVLPLVRLRSRMFGDYAVSMPYFNYGGALGLTSTIEESLMRESSETARHLGVTHIEFRDTHEREGWTHVRTDKVIMVLRLADTVDALWSSLGSKLRAQIKRPMKEGACTVFGGSELLDEFYAVFTRNMRDLGTPVYGRKFFARILEEFPTQALVAVVRLDREPVAAGFLMGHGDSMEIPWASSLREYNRLSANMLLYWECLKRAVELGKKQFDFGRSSADSGTYRFKAQWGARPRQLYWHYWLNDGANMPDLSPRNPKFQLAIKVWQRLPLALTNTLGPCIVKNLP
jgi:FemAB-related protein (PEP-CTERM system-associated)